MQELTFSIDMPARYADRPVERETEIVDQLCRFFGFQKFPMNLAIDTSVEGDDDDQCEVQVTIWEML